MLHGVLYTLCLGYILLCVQIFFLYAIGTLDSSFLIQLFMATSKTKLKAGLVRLH